MPHIDLRVLFYAALAAAFLLITGEGTAATLVPTSVGGGALIALLALWEKGGREPLRSSLRFGLTAVALAALIVYWSVAPAPSGVSWALPLVGLGLIAGVFALTSRSQSQSANGGNPTLG